MKALSRMLVVVMLFAVTAGCSLTGGYRGERMCMGTSLCDRHVGTMKMSDGVSIPYCSWLPATSRPRGIIIVVPGFDESAREMHYLGAFATAHQYAAFACDLRGQGADPDTDRLGNFPHWKRWVDDVQDLTRFARKRYPHAPIFYVGQSTGAIVALNAVSRMDQTIEPKGIVLQSPAVLFVLRPAYVPPLLLTGQIVTLNHFRATTPALLALKKQSIMENGADEAAWERSPDRVCKGFTLRSVRGCYSLGTDTGQRMPAVKEPVLVQFGSDDPLFQLTADTTKSPGQFVSMIGSPDKQALWIRNGRHDMLNDRTTRHQLLAQLESWLLVHNQ